MKFGTDHEEMTIAIVCDDLTLISNMHNSNMLLSKPSYRNEVSPQLRDVQNVLESEGCNDAINRSLNMNITDPSDIEDIVVSNYDCPTLISNRLKIGKPLKFISHVLGGTEVSKPKSIFCGR